MKKIISILSLLLLTTFTLSAQVDNKGTLSSTFKKTFTIKVDGTETKYNLKILETRNYPMAWKDEDKGKVDQDRMATAAKVTKMIAVDNDSDNEYEQYFVLKYRKSLADTFEVVATKNGFAVMVDGTIKKHFDKEGIYFIDNDDKDFFSVTEFGEMG
ncbi:hypothetical protein [Ulvibacterium sp.]|uniref:hypothetical protein n=1 Tax=Ulvibacterium sp. TaxID=2665914 RepID=UPI003BA84C88